MNMELLSNADYLHFLNCGDVVTPSFVSVLNELSDHSKPYCVHTYPSLQYYNSYRKSRVFLPPKSKFASLVTNTWAHSSLIYPSSLFKITQYDIKYSCAADYDLTLSALFNLGYKYISHPTHNCIVLMAPGFSYTHRKESISQLRLVRNKFILLNILWIPYIFLSYLEFKLTSSLIRLRLSFFYYYYPTLSPFYASVSDQFPSISSASIVFFLLSPHYHKNSLNLINVF